MRFIERNAVKTPAPPPRLGQRITQSPPGSNVVTLDFGPAVDRPAPNSFEQPAFKIPNFSDANQRESCKLLYAAIATSLILHAGIMTSMFMRDSGEEFGTLADKTDTFSLSMEQSIVLESISTESMQTAAAAATAAQAGSVQAVESMPQELAEVENETVKDDPPPKPTEIADVTPTTVAPTDEPLAVIHGGGEQQEVSEIKSEQISETEVREMPDAAETKDDALAKAEKKKEKEKEKKTPQQESHQQVAGSTTSRSSVAPDAVNGKASASRGNSLSYGAMVRARLARNKPMAIGVRGTVRVSFGISDDGGIRYLRVSESSGSATLDKTALDVIRKSAPFGEPPPDLAPSQLAYVIPFYFR